LPDWRKSGRTALKFVELPIPAPGQTVRLTIDDIAFGGEGVGRLNDFVVFVPFVALGETVEAELVEVKKRFGRARLLKVLEASPDRVAPACRYFGECGGCQYQHIAYPAQLRIKHKQVCDLLQRIGGIDPALVEPVVPCPEPYGYRNRIMIRSQWDKFKQGLNIGYLRADNRLVVDIEECKIAEPVLNEQIRLVRQEPPPKGGIKVVLRAAAKDWEVPRDAFFQNNFHLLPKLVETVGDRLGDSGSRFLIDAYCGVGFFSIELGGLVEEFAGVEVDTASIQAARRNALTHGRNNGQFLVGRAEEFLPRMLGRFDARCTTVILDPPRTGCPPEMLQALREASPRQVLYVSCHPATLARDLNVLRAGNVFEVTKIVPLDMFPQTQHTECVADVRLTATPTCGA
jgi:tRNA/tmRNA/rRNA uracil-C5-methylase (TrmA/RlmC/RlmD family)